MSHDLDAILTRAGLCLGLTIRKAGPQPVIMGITEHAAAGRAQLIVATPRARSKIPTGMGFREGNTTRDWKAGEVVTLRLRLWTFAAPSLQTLFDRFAEARKDYGTRSWTHDVPFSEAARLVRDKLNALNWDEWLGYYRHGIDKTKAKPFDWFQLGWVSGGVTTLPMLSQGDALSQARARRNLDFMFTQLPLPNGLWCAHHDGVKVNYDDPRPPRPGYLVSVRRMSDGLYYDMKQIRILAERGEAVPTAWEDAARGLADAFIRLFNRYGQIGQYLDVRHATIGIGGSTAAGGVPAGLALVAKHFNEPPTSVQPSPSAATSSKPPWKRASPTAVPATPWRPPTASPARPSSCPWWTSTRPRATRIGPRPPAT